MSRECESREESQTGVANVSREWCRETGVANVSCEWSHKMWVTKRGSQMGVARIKKSGAYVIGILKGVINK